MSNTTLYGIPNCDTVRKAKNWLTKNNIDYRFHDFRKDGLQDSTLDSWLKQLELSKIVNKRSTSWKQLSDNEKQAVLDENLDLVKNILMQHPTLIKRPVLEANTNVTCGFNNDEYQNIFS